MRRVRIAATVILIPATLAAIPADGRDTTASTSVSTPAAPARPFAHVTETRIPTRAAVYQRLHQAMSEEIAAFQTERARLMKIRAHASGLGDVETVRRIELMAMQSRAEHLQQLDELRRQHAPWLKTRSPRQRLVTVPEPTAARPVMHGATPAARDGRDDAWRDLQASARQRTIDTARRRIEADATTTAIAAGPADGTSIFRGERGGTAAAGFSVNRGHLQRARERADRYRVGKRRDSEAG